MLKKASIAGSHCWHFKHQPPWHCSVPPWHCTKTFFPHHGNKAFCIGCSQCVICQSQLCACYGILAWWHCNMANVQHVLGFLLGTITMAKAHQVLNRSACYWKLLGSRSCSKAIRAFIWYSKIGSYPIAQSMALKYIHTQIYIYICNYKYVCSYVYIMCSI